MPVHDKLARRSQAASNPYIAIIFLVWHKNLPYAFLLILLFLLLKSMNAWYSLQDVGFAKVDLKFLAMIIKQDIPFILPRWHLILNPDPCIIESISIVDLFKVCQ